MNSDPRCKNLEAADAVADEAMSPADQSEGAVECDGVEEPSHIEVRKMVLARILFILLILSARNQRTTLNWRKFGMRVALCDDGGHQLRRIGVWCDTRILTSIDLL